MKEKLVRVQCTYVKDLIGERVMASDKHMGALATLRVREFDELRSTEMALR